jgi:hypothetical protein
MDILTKKLHGSELDWLQSHLSQVKISLHAIIGCRFPGGLGCVDMKATQVLLLTIPTSFNVDQIVRVWRVFPCCTVFHNFR